LHLLGGGSLEATLRAQVARLGLQDALQFHGRLDDMGMAAVLARCKLSISVPASDATSVSVLESMACGLPVIATDLPANRDWLDAALLVPVGDAAALARLWQALADDDARAQCIGAAHAERIAREGDRRVQMDVADRLYRNLLAERAGERS
jgi:glycosyltransferase involved in cell wall biosynthesis